MAAALSSKVAVQSAFKAAPTRQARRASVAVQAAGAPAMVPDMGKRTTMVCNERRRAGVDASPSCQPGNGRL
jgi:hypothetical protein